MSHLTRIVLLVALVVGLLCQAGQSQTTKKEGSQNSKSQAKNPQPEVKDSKADMSVDEIRSLLHSIDPYLPQQEVEAEIDIFGSTSMDALAHGWAAGFQKFHSKAKVVVSAKGSERAFATLIEDPSSIGMFSRPVTEEELNELKQKGLKQPVAISVAREALAIFVHQSNPMESIGYPQLAAIFCSEDPAAPITWGAMGLTGALAQKPIHVMGREQGSGTRKFVEGYLFASQKMRKDEAYFESNAELMAAIEKDPLAIGIGSLKCGSHSARALKLRDGATIIGSTDHDVLVGRYPLTRPLTLVLDVGQQSPEAIASQEFARYAVSQAGQIQAIVVGFFPFDPPRLRAENYKLSHELKGQEVR